MDLDEQADLRPLARVGTTVGGVWRIEDLLGVGGAATVYSALHANGRRVALKIMHRRLRQDRDLCERFLQEAELAAAIDHPARVIVHGVSATDHGTPLLMMELLEGCTLEAVLDRLGALDAAPALMIAEQALSFLAACHARSIVHRDIKPSNVFLTLDGRVKMLDLGVALDKRRRLTTRRLAIGTPTHMSPEQARGTLDVDARADVFAVGALLFHALSGMQPRSGRTPRELLETAAMEAVRPVHLVAPHLPAHVAALVDSATSFERTERWPDASTMQDAIKAALARLPRSSTNLADLAQNAFCREELTSQRATVPEFVARPSLPNINEALPAS